MPPAESAELVFEPNPSRPRIICCATHCLGPVLAGCGDRAIVFVSDIHIAATGFSKLVVFLLFSNDLVCLQLGILGEDLDKCSRKLKRLSPLFSNAQ